MKVVIADDSELLLELMSALLTQRGHEVKAVTDGHAAWDAIERDTPPLVLLDWQMPTLDGLEVCRRIRSHPPTANTFVLMVTGQDRPADLAAALDAGVDDYLQKPVTADELHARCTIAERRITLDSARRDAEERAARAQWMAGVGHTALSVQHEINNPLAALLGWVAIAEMENVDDAERRNLMVSIGEQGRRIAAVVKRLASLEDPRTVEYIKGQMMLDLGGYGESGFGIRDSGIGELWSWGSGFGNCRD